MKKNTSIRKLINGKFFVRSISIESCDHFNNMKGSEFYGKYSVMFHRKRFGIFGYKKRYKNPHYIIKNINKYLKRLNSISDNEYISTFHNEKGYHIFCQFHFHGKFEIKFFFIYIPIIIIVLLRFLGIL